MRQCSHRGMSRAAQATGPNRGDDVALDVDWLDETLDALFDEPMHADRFDEYAVYPPATFDDAEYAEDVTPPIGTNHVAALILAEAVRASVNPTGPRGFAAFGVTQQGVQAEPTNLVQSLVDAQWTGQDGARINLEVDHPAGRSRRESPRGIDTHKRDHLRAMAAAVGRGHAPSSARSVFVTTDPQGRIVEVRHVHYETRADRPGQVVAVPDAHVRLNQPLTPQQAWASRVLENPQVALQQGQQVPASRRRTFSQPVLSPATASAPANPPQTALHKSHSVGVSQERVRQPV